MICFDSSMWWWGGRVLALAVVAGFWKGKKWVEVILQKGRDTYQGYLPGVVFILQGQGCLPPANPNLGWL